MSADNLGGVFDLGIAGIAIYFMYKLADRAIKTMKEVRNGTPSKEKGS